MSLIFIPIVNFVLTISIENIYMCGFYFSAIIGSNDNIDREFVQRSLFNRGPDYYGWLEDSSGATNFLFHHSRLAITDLDSRSNQPMIINDVVILFNGEIYNYKQIRSDLVKEYNVEFKTESDTEVVIASYLKYGVESFDLFDGPFSIVIYDRAHDLIIIARDKFGEKPLFISRQNNRLRVSSIPVLTAIDINKFNYNFIKQYKNCGYSYEGLTQFEGTYSVDNGSCLIFDAPSLEQTEVRKFHYYDVGSRLNVANGIEESFYEIFKTSLSDRLNVDKRIPSGLLLSGGIDSSFIAVFAKQELGISLDCYTITTDERAESDEIARAKKLCSYLGLNHTLLKLCSAKNKKINPKPYIPISDPAYPYLLDIYKSVPENMKVMISGDGADELFLSYSNYKNLTFTKSKDSQIYKIIAPIIFMFSSSILTRLGLSIWDIFKARLHRVGALDSTDDKVNLMQDYAVNYEFSEYLSYKSDCASMAYSIELRTPFLSPKLFNHFKYNSFNKSEIVQKDLMVNYLNDVLGKDYGFKKQGFAAGSQRKTTSRFANFINRVFNDRLYRIKSLKEYFNEK